MKLNEKLNAQDLEKNERLLELNQLLGELKLELNNTLSDTRSWYVSSLEMEDWSCLLTLTNQYWSYDVKVSNVDSQQYDKLCGLVNCFCRIYYTQDKLTWIDIISLSSENEKFVKDGKIELWYSS